MWQARPEKEYRREAWKRGFTYLIKPWWITFVVTIVALMSFRLYLGTRWLTGPAPARTRGVATIICGALLLHMILAELFRYRGQKSNPDRVICDTCHAVKDDDGNPTCPCGGRYIDLLRMQWVEQDNEA